MSVSEMVEMVKNSSSFVLLRETENMKAGKEYALYESESANVVHSIDDGGSMVIHTFKGSISYELKEIINSGYIRFFPKDGIEHQQEGFQINEVSEVHHSDPRLYDITIRVNEEHKNILEDMQTELEKECELNRLYEERMCLDKQITEVEQYLANN